MDVTKLNFKENFQRFQTALSQSDFVAVDAEFSGLYNKLRLNPLDEFSERYDLLRKHLKQYILLQVGICCFRSVSPGEYICQPFNFNIFPYCAEQNKEFNTAFLCDSNTLAFLAENNFDFNKVIYSGVPYMISVKNLLRQSHSIRTSSSLRAELSGEMQFLQKCIQIRNGQTIDTPPPEQLASLQDVTQEFPETPLSLSDEIPLTPSEPELISDPGLPVQNENLEKLVEMTSFNQIMHILSYSNIPVIFHNGILDLFHLTNMFFGPLPEKWEDFKFRIHRLFPQVFDTKYLACVDPFREFTDGSSLQAVWEKFSEKFPIKIEFPPEFQRYSNGAEYQHEAAYDAMMTGHIFGCMSSLYARIDKHGNEIFFGLQGIFHFGLARKDLRPQRENVIHISTKSSQHNIVKDEIIGLMSPFSVVQNFWYHNSSVFVMLRKTLSKSDLFKLRSNSAHSKYNMMSYEEYYKAKRKIMSNESEPIPKRNKNYKSYPEANKPKFHSKYVSSYDANGASEDAVFPNVDDWDQ